MGWVINVHQWTGHTGPLAEVGVSGPHEKTRLHRLFAVIKGADSTQMWLHLQVTFVPAQGFCVAEW